MAWPSTADDEHARLTLAWRGGSASKGWCDNSSRAAAAPLVVFDSGLRHTKKEHLNVTRRCERICTCMLISYVSYGRRNVHMMLSTAHALFHVSTGSARERFACATTGHIPRNPLPRLRSFPTSLTRGSLPELSLKRGTDMHYCMRLCLHCQRTPGQSLEILVAGHTLCPLVTLRVFHRRSCPAITAQQDATLMLRASSTARRTAHDARGWPRKRRGRKHQPWLLEPNIKSYLSPQRITRNTAVRSKQWISFRPRSCLVT